MNFDYRVKGEVKVSMINYMKEIVDEFPEEISGSVNTPVANNLFDVRVDPEYLDKHKVDIFHHTVAKILWASMRARPNLLVAISFLTSRVQKPDEDNWKKLIRIIKYIKCTIDLSLILSADNTGVIKWWIDASFATKSDMHSQTGSTMSMGKGIIHSFSKKQKMNTKSSTEAELVEVNDLTSQILWTKNFLESQGYTVNENRV